MFAFGDQMQGRDRLWVLLIIVVPALLMVSTIRFRSFRSLLSKDHLGLTAAILVVVAVGLVLVPGPTGLVLAYGYVLTCPIGWLTAPLRRRWFGPGTVAPPRRPMPSVLLPIADPEPADEDELLLDGDDPAR